MLKFECARRWSAKVQGTSRKETLVGYRESEGHSGELSAECRGYELRDREGEKIGKVDEVFVGDNDRPEYLGVKTGLLGNKLTLIPADLARADEERRMVELSESKDRIKGAPSLSANEEINAEREREVRDHFGLGSGASSAASDQSSSSPGYRDDSRSSGSPDTGESAERGNRSSEGGTTGRREPWSGSESGSESDSGRGPESGAGTGRPREEPAGESSSAADRGGETTGHGAAAGSTETGERRGARDASARDDDRETVRVSVWREKARAERVLGDDGSEEVRIRKEWAEEEEIVEVEGRRGNGGSEGRAR